MEIKACISTDKGTVKEVNQDSTLVKVAMSDKVGRIGIGVLCDGMGGLSHGEVASAMLIDRFNEWFMYELPKVLTHSNSTEKLDGGEGEYDIIADIRHEWMSIAVDMNSNIYQYGMDHGAALGTTVVSFLSIGNEFIVMNVGDSRAYMVTDESVELMTHDQSVVQDMIDRGIITRQEAENSPQKSVLLQCIGASGSVEPQFIRGRIAEDTSIILCSDGFWRRQREEEFHEMLSPEAAINDDVMTASLDELTHKVMKRGETDNVSAVYMNYKI